MTWYFKVKGGHTHVRVFMNGGKCGNLVFRNHEFEGIRKGGKGIVFIDEDPDPLVDAVGKARMEGGAP